MATDWTVLGAEPSLHDLMTDPIMALLWCSDRIGPNDVFSAVDRARLALKTGGTKVPVADCPGARVLFQINVGADDSSCNHRIARRTSGPHNPTRSPPRRAG